VGLGRTGKAVAIRALAFQMRVVAHDPYPDEAWAAKHRVTLLPLERLLAEADFVSLHLPATESSRHLINARTLALMKPSAFLVNTARGAVVNEADLYQALKAGRLAGAALDVFEQEPPVACPLLTPATPASAGRGSCPPARSAAGPRGRRRGGSPTGWGGPSRRAPTW
jgi:phosphoglycerate dehydrogenase-like enzyme